MEIQSTQSGSFSASALVANATFWVVLTVWIVTGPDHDRFGYVIWCVATCVLAFWVVVNPWRTDPLEPVKLVSGLHGLGFGIGPLMLAPTGAYSLPYLGPEHADLLDRGAMFAFFALAAFLIGYHGLEKRLPPGDYRPQPVSGSLMLGVGGCALMGAGAFAYAAILTAGGGWAAFATYSGGRAEIFQLQGIFGGLYWATFLMVGGVCALGAALAPRHPWLCCAVGLAVAGAFAPFQGRDEVLAPLFCVVVLIHYLRRRIRVRWFVLGCAIAATLAMTIGYYRSLDEGGKRTLFRSPATFVGDFQADFGDHVNGLMAKNIEQMDVFLVALRYVDSNEKTLRGTTFLHWLEPIDRHLLGGKLDFEAAGRIFAELINPDHRYLVTAASPSMVGELYLNFGAFGLLLGMALWGRVLQSLYNLARRATANPAAIILYPYAVWILAKATIDGSVLFFRIFVVGLPLLALYLLLRNRRASAAHEESPPQVAHSARGGLVSHELHDGLLLPATRASSASSRQLAGPP